MKVQQGIITAVLAAVIATAPTWAQCLQGTNDPRGPEFAKGQKQAPVLQKMQEGGNSQGNQPEQEADRASRLMGLLLENKEFADTLGLTDKQKAEMQTSATEYRRDSMEFKHKLETSGLTQLEALSETKIDEKKLMNAVEEAGKIRTEIAKLRMNQLLTFRKILTPEQIAKIKEHRMQMRANRQGGNAGTSPIRQQRLERIQRAEQSSHPPVPGRPIEGGEGSAEQMPPLPPEGPGPDQGMAE